MPIKPITRILVIDDEPRILRFLQKPLQLAGYTVQGVPSGIEGLDKMIDTWPDLVLLDLGLPDLDGLEVLRRARCQADGPVIILTARDEKEITFPLGKLEQPWKWASYLITNPKRRAGAPDAGRI